MKSSSVRILASFYYNSTCRKDLQKMDRRSGRNSFTSAITSEHNGDSSHEMQLDDERRSAHSEYNGNSSVESLAINMGSCVLCSKNAVCKCERCDDYYCSPQCQRKDWPKHRYICFPMPRLVKVQQFNHMNDAPPILKANLSANKESSKEEKKMSYKTRQLSYIPSQTALPVDGSAVVVTGFKSSNRCSIRSADKAASDEYFNTLAKIDNCGRNAGEMQAYPKPNSFGLAQMNGAWSRVQIIQARPEERVSVYFTDYGFIRFVHLHELKKIPGGISSLPCYVNTVQLHGVNWYSVDANVLDHLTHLTNKKFKMQIVDQDDKGGNIKLFYIDTNNSVNKDIIEICRKLSSNKDSDSKSSSKPCANSVAVDEDKAEKTEDVLSASSVQTHTGCKETDAISVGSNEASTGSRETDAFSVGSNETRIAKTENKTTVKCVIDSTTENSQASNMADDPCMIPPFKITEFDPEIQAFKVIVVDSSYVVQGLLGCILESHVPNFMAVQNFLETWKDTKKPYKPKLNEYCIAQFDSDWYRAKVVDIINDDKFVVTYIDFSNEAEVTTEFIRHYPMELKLSCTTNVCALAGLPETLSAEVVNCLENFLNQNKGLMVDSFKVVDSYKIITCNELLKELRSKKFIK